MAKKNISNKNITTESALLSINKTLDSLVDSVNFFTNTTTNKKTLDVFFNLSNKVDYISKHTKQQTGLLNNIHNTLIKNNNIKNIKKPIDNVIPNVDNKINNTLIKNNNIKNITTESALLSINKTLDSLVDSVNFFTNTTTNKKTLDVFFNLSNKVDYISKHTKQQTGLLNNIHNTLIKNNNIKNIKKPIDNVIPNVDNKINNKFKQNDNNKNDIAIKFLFGKDFTNFIKVLNKVDDNTTKNVKELFTSLYDGFEKLNKLKDVDKSTKMVNILFEFIKEFDKFLVGFVKIKLFRATIDDSVNIISNILISLSNLKVDDNIGKNLKNIIDSTDNLISFAWKISTFSFIFNKKLIDSGINNLQHAIDKLNGSINIDINENDIKSIELLSNSVFKFGFTMSMYLPLSPSAYLSSLIFRNTLNNLSKIDFDKLDFDKLVYLNNISNNILQYGKNMSIYSIYAPQTFVSSNLFAKSVDNLTSILSSSKINNLDENASEKLLKSTKDILLFGSLLSNYNKFGKSSLNSTILLIDIIDNLTNTLNDSNMSKIANESNLNKLQIIGVNVFKLGQGLYAFSIISKGAERGVKSFESLINNLFDVIKKSNADKLFKKLEPIKGIGIGILQFGLGLATYAIVGIPAMFGVLLFSSTIFLLNKFLNKNFDKSLEGIKSINSIGYGIILFGLGLSAYAIVGIPAMVGAMLFSVTIKMLTWAFNDFEKIETDYIKSLANITLGLVIFGASMALIGPYWKNILIGSGAVATGLFVVLSSLYIVNRFIAKDGNLDNITRNLLLLGLGILGFSASLIFVSNYNEKIITGGITIGIVMLGISTIVNLMGTPYARSGITGLLLSSIAIIGITSAFVLWDNYGLNDYKKILPLIGTIGGIVAITALAGVAFPVIALGGLSMAIIGTGLLLLSFALITYKKVSWTDDDSSTLSNTISSLFGAMSTKIDNNGNSNKMTITGSIVNTMISLINSSALIFASVGILFMSVALAAFKLVKWTNEDSNKLSYTISSILLSTGGMYKNDKNINQNHNSLNGLVNSVSSLIGSASIFLASFGILILSGALATFKKVSWTDEDTNNLSYTISSVLGVVSGKYANKDSVIETNTPERLLTTTLSLFGSGAIFAASSGILLLSFALQKFKNIEWGDEHNILLKSTINNVLESFGGKPESIKQVGGTILSTILSMISAGGIFMAAGGIWLLSDALQKFKDIKWDIDKDNKALKSVISGVNESFKGSKLDSDAKKNIKALEKINKPLERFIKILSIFKDSKFTSDDITIITTSITDIIDIIPNESIDNKINNIKSLGTSIENYTKSLYGFKNVKWTNKDNNLIIDNISNVLSTVDKNLSLEFDNLDNINKHFNSFFNTLNVYKKLNWTDNDNNKLDKTVSILLNLDIGTKFDGLNTLAKNFNKISKSFKEIRGHINSLDEGKLQLTESLMTSMAILSKNPSAISNTIRMSIEQSFNKLSNELDKLLKNILSNNSKLMSSDISDALSSAIIESFNNNNNNNFNVNRFKQNQNNKKSDESQVSKQSTNNIIQTIDYDKLADALKSALLNSGFKIGVTEEGILIKQS